MALASVYPDADMTAVGPGQAISEVAPFLIDLPVERPIRWYGCPRSPTPPNPSRR